VGATNSSNSNRLRELGEQKGVESYLIANAGEINKVWLDEKQKIAVTAGASAPEILVQQVVDRLKEFGATVASESEGIVETISFTLPRELRKSS